MEKTKKIGMKWYNYLVHFWLPLNIFLNLLLIVLVGRIFSPVIIALFSPQYEVVSSEIVTLLMVVYILLCMLILPFFYTMGVRKSLRKCKPNALKRLAGWYIMPALIFLGVWVFNVVMAYDGYIWGLYLSAVAALRALIMIPLNKRYFNKRAELFGLRPKRSRKKKNETDQTPEEIAQAPEEISQESYEPAPQKKRRATPGELVKRAANKLYVTNNDYPLPF